MSFLYLIWHNDLKIGDIEADDVSKWIEELGLAVAVVMVPTHERSNDDSCLAP